MFASLAENSNEESGYWVRIHGTEHHIHELRTIAGEGEVSHECTATLRCDPLATPDFAVCVIVHGSPVGYLGGNQRYGIRATLRRAHAKLSCCDLVQSVGTVAAGCAP